MVSPQVLRIPLQAYKVPGITETLLRGILGVSIRVGPRRLADLNFIFDSACPLTTIPVARALAIGLAIPHRRIEVNLETATGKATQIRHPGRIQGKIMGLAGWDFDWPCHFAEHEGPPPKAQLGPVGVLDHFRLTLDGQYALEAPHGWLIVERTT